MDLSDLDEESTMTVRVKNSKNKKNATKDPAPYSSESEGSDNEYYSDSSSEDEAEAKKKKTTTTTTVAAAAAKATKPQPKKKKEEKEEKEKTKSAGKRKESVAGAAKSKAKSVSREAVAPKKKIHRPTGSSTSVRAGLSINIGRVERTMRRLGLPRLSKRAPIVMAAIIEYVIADICDKANEQRLNSTGNPVRTSVEHVAKAIKNDPELMKMIGQNSSIIGSCVQPWIDPTIANKKKKKRGGGNKTGSEGGASADSDAMVVEDEA